MFLCILYVNLGWKTRFFLQKLAYFTTKNNANKLKRNVFSKTAIESAKKTGIQLTHSVRSKNLGRKTLKNRKKKF